MSNTKLKKIDTPYSFKKLLLLLSLLIIFLVLIFITLSLDAILFESSAGSSNLISIDSKINGEEYSKANIGDIITVTSNIKNTSNDIVSDVFWGIIIPPNMEYQTGSLKINGNIYSDVFQNGITVPIHIDEILKSSQAEVSLKVKIADNQANYLSVGDNTLIIDSQVVSAGVNMVSDKAFAVINKQSNISLDTDTYLYNISKDGSNGTKNKEINASIGDILEIEVNVTNKGSSKSLGTKIGIILPPWIERLSVSSSPTLLDGARNDFDGVRSPVVLGDLDSNSKRTVKIRVKIVDLDIISLKKGINKLQIDGHGVSFNAARDIDSVFVKVIK